MSGFDYKNWLRETGLSTTPARDRRTHAREELEGIDKTLERAEAQKKHAPTRRAADRIERKIDELDQRAVAARAELGSGAYVHGQPAAPTCDLCGAETDRHKLDYGTCYRCLSGTPNPDRR